ncbi:hypothetical protein [Paracidovorax konjaci]|nr:hypothetical protein [Paracidovorax konjaci]
MTSLAHAVAFPAALSHADAAGRALAAAAERAHRPSTPAPS